MSKKINVSPTEKKRVRAYDFLSSIKQHVLKGTETPRETSALMIDNIEDHLADIIEKDIDKNDLTFSFHLENTICRVIVLQIFSLSTGKSETYIFNIDRKELSIQEFGDENCKMHQM